MYEFRQDVLTGDWVCIATKRQGRPSVQKKLSSQNSLVEYDLSCPFCPGNETETPPEVYALRDSNETDSPGWQIRVVPNLYPAVTDNPVEKETCEDRGICVPGYGRHEVLIETPSHNLPWREYSDAHGKNVICTIRDRSKMLREVSGVESVVVFKNHGLRAGISIYHPHLQIAALPIVPALTARRMAILEACRRSKKECLFCNMIEQEMKDGQRIVFETEKFVVMNPYASRLPFETWIAPKAHIQGVHDFDDLHCAEFAQALMKTMNLLYEGIGEFDYNFSFIDGPVTDPEKDFHGFLRIIPRLVSIAGFELGQETYMNTHSPEQTASMLRDII